MINKISLFLALALVSFICLKLYLSFRVPYKLRSLPRIPLIQTLIDLFQLKPFDKAILDRSRKIMEKHHISTTFFQGNWTVAVSSIEAAEKIYKHPKMFPKALLTEILPKSVITLFLGTNVVFSNGEVWKKHRHVVNPPFKKGFEPKIFGDLVDNLFTILDKSIGSDVEIHSLIQRLTIDALGKAAMGLDFNSILNPNVPFINNYNIVMKSFSPLAIVFPFIETPLNPFRKPIFDAVLKLETHFKNILMDRRKRIAEESLKEEELADLLTLMLHDQAKDGFTDKEIRDNIMVFLLAGQDTTALSLCVALYFLASHPECQDRLFNEISNLKGFNSCTPVIPTHQQLREMPYLVAFIKETLRMYPAVARLPTRVAAEDVELEGYLIPKGTNIVIDTLLIHRDPSYWKNPDTFDPSRFMGGDHDSVAWSPFGGGSRLCLGMNFSLLEQKVVLVMLLQKFKIMPGSNSLTMLPSLLLAPNNLKLSFIPRV